MLSMTKKLDPSVATAGKNRICLSEFREQVLMFHQNLVSRRSDTLERSLVKAGKNSAEKKQNRRTWKNRKFSMVQKGQYFVPYTTMHI